MAADPVQVQLFGDKSLARRFKNLERNMQRKVLRPMVDKVAKNTVKPILQNELPTRSFNPPKNRSYRGQPGPSHTGPPGVLKRNLKVRPVKRSRTFVGRVVMMPTKDVLGIDDDYDFYYPAALEYGVKFNKLLGRPQLPKPVFRTVYQRHESTIMQAVQREAAKALAAQLRKS